MGENKMFQCEGESILPDVEELPEFHSDHLSTLSDIQEELEKLDPFDTVKEEVSLMEDVNIVDHEVTIGDEQINEEFTEGAEETQSTEKPTIISGIVENSFSTSEDRTLEETIAIIPPSSNVSASGRANSHVEPENLRVVPNKHHNVHNPPPLKAIRPLPEGLQGNKSFIAMSQPKKNMVTKVIFSPTSQTTADGSTIMLTESGGQTIRIVGQNKPTILPNSPRTLTLAQAREMGLLPGGKMQLLQSQSKSVVRKSVMMTGNKPVTLMKSPTKILPLPTSGQLHAIAPSPSINSLTQSPQKIFIRQTGPAVRPGGFSGTLLTSGPAGAAGQLLQIPATVNQDAINQIHQIQLPGKQVQYVRLVHTPVSTTGATVTATSAVPVEMIKSDPIFITTTSEPTLVTANPRPQASSPPVSSPMPMPNLKVMPITPATPTHQSSNSFERILVSPGLSQLKGKTDAKTATSNIVMVPAEYVKQFKQNPVPTTQSTTTLTGSVLSSAKAATPAGSPVVSKAKEALVAKEPALTPAPTPPAIKDRKDPPNGLRPRKPCNCTKSQCLKLYCDCFANGEFCFQCNCNCCYNNLDHEEDRQRAIRSCLERNPNAFRPKIGKGYVGDERRHNKGCHCKRSGCLKNYCECYEAKIPCSNNCKCIGCKNVEDGKDKGHERNRLVPIAVRPKPTIETVDKSITYLSSQNMRQPYARITQHVVEAACECLLAQVQEGSTPQQVERRIIEEFSRCLVTVIGFSRTAVNNLT